MTPPPAPMVATPLDRGSNVPVRCETADKPPHYTIQYQNIMSFFFIRMLSLCYKGLDVDVHEEDTDISSSMVVYVGIGCAASVIIIIAGITLICYVTCGKAAKRRNLRWVLLLFTCTHNHHA